MRNYFYIKSVVLVLLILFSGIGAVFANSPVSDSFVTRGKASEMIVDYFDLKTENMQYLSDCDADPDSCMFAFSARTNFDNFRIDPLILYPDVYPAYRYYEAINLLSKLDIVSGYYAEEQSPFRPEQPITKVEALKMVMGASGMMSWKEKFELNGTGDSSSWLAFDFGGDKWWYQRYLAAAFENGFLVEVSANEAESTISENELLKIMESAHKIVAQDQEMSLIDMYGQLNSEAYTSGNPGSQTNCGGSFKTCPDAAGLGIGQYS